MIVRCTSDVPPAIDAAFDHNHWRCQKPPPGFSCAPHQSGAAAPTTSSARADNACVMSDHASLVTLDSAPGSMPLVSRERVRQLCSRSTRSSTNDCASADRKSTRLNSSHLGISYAVFCLKKKKNTTELIDHTQKLRNHIQQNEPNDE